MSSKKTTKKPVVQSGDKYPHPVSIRFSTEERKRINKAAERDNMSFGGWVREVANQVAGGAIKIQRKVEVKRTKAA
jgi:uncharacterized protein (DUF1778 family)